MFNIHFASRRFLMQQLRTPGHGPALFPWGKAVAVDSGVLIDIKCALKGRRFINGETEAMR